MEKEDAVPSDIFPHVYSFLVRFGFLKSAKLFRKEANVPRVVVDTPGLLDFYEAFKKRKKKNVDALQTEERITSKTKRKREKQINTQTLKKKKQSTSESSSEEEKEEQKTSVTKKPNSNVTKTLKNINSKKKDKQVVSVNVQPAEEESSSSSSSDNEPTKSNGLQGDAGASSRVLPKHKKIAAAVKKSASSSSGDSSSEGDNPVKAASSSAAKQSQNDDGDSSTNSSSDTPIAKQPVPIVQPHTIPKANKKPKTTPTSTQPFCRVDKQTVVDPKLADNSFEAKSGARGSWGEKAHHTLKNTKGRSFRHEKTKKKRGSYAGGRIDVGVHSIKFDDSD